MVCGGVWRWCSGVMRVYESAMEKAPKIDGCKCGFVCVCAVKKAPQTDVCFPHE